MSTVSEDKLAYGEMSLVVLLWGISWPLGKIVATGGLGSNPFLAAFIRYFFAIPFLLLFTKLIHKTIALPRQFTKQLLVFGVLHVSLYNFFFLSSLRFTSSSDAVLILNASISFISAILSSLVYADENLTQNKVVGIFLTLGGVAIVFFASPNTQVDNRLLGNLIILLAALVWSFYTVYSRPIYQEVPPLQFQLWSTIFGWIILGIFAVIEIFFVTPGSIQVDSIGALLYLGVLGAALPNTLFSLAIKHIGPMRTTIIINFVPLVGIFSAVLLLGEEFSFLYVISFLVTFIGIYLVNKPEVAIAPTPVE